MRSRKRRIYTTVEALSELRLVERRGKSWAGHFARLQKKELLKMLKRLGLTIGLFMLLFSSAAEAQTIYPLYCRGGVGPNYERNSIAFSDGPNTAFPNAPQTYHYVQIGISKSTGNKYTLNPGECVWGGRVMTSGDPSYLIAQIPARPPVVFYSVPMPDGVHRLAACVSPANNGAAWYFPSSTSSYAGQASCAWPSTTDDTTNIDNRDYFVNSIMDANSYYKYAVYFTNNFLVISSTTCSSNLTNKCW